MFNKGLKEQTDGAEWTQFGKPFKPLIRQRRRANENARALIFALILKHFENHLLSAGWQSALKGTSSQSNLT